MRSIETIFVELKEQFKNLGKSDECETILESLKDKSLEEKVAKLEAAAKPAMTSAKLVESFRVFGLTEQEAKIAAGVERRTPSGHSWDILTETKR